MENTPPTNEQTVPVPTPMQTSPTPTPSSPKRKLSLWWKILPIVGFSFLIAFIVVNAQQSVGSDFVDKPGWWRLGAFIRLGFFLEVALGIGAFVWAIRHFSRQPTSKRNPFYVLVLGFTTVVMSIACSICAVFAVRAAIALVSSPVSYEGSCTVSYSYYGGGGHPGSIGYYLKVPGKHNGMRISENTYKTLSGEAAYSHSLSGIRNESTPEYPCLQTVRLQYVSAEDTIIDLKILYN